MVLVFDVGGTNIRLALSDDGQLHEVVRIPTDPTAAGFAKFLGHVQELVGDNHISAVAGGFPGQVTGEERQLVLARNLNEWVGQPVGASLEEILDCPVEIANDMEMCGLGEAHVGGGLKEGVMAYLTVSTGVNGVRIIDGEIDRSVERFEIGHQIINHAGDKTQSLEELVGGASLQKRLGKAPRDVEDSKIWRELERYLAAGLYNVMLYWHPARIVLGGSMMRDIKIKNVADELAQMTPIFDEWPELVSAKLGDEAGLHGALVRLRQLGHK